MGEKGWHSRGYLPHFDGWDVIQHVVFRLNDALPPGERDGDDVLDRGFGSSLLREPRCARIVANALMHHDTERYALHAWCIMPNHVHALLATTKQHDLGSIVRLWKAYTAAQINKMLGRRGRLWAADYLDRYIRDDAHYDANKHYIEMNPVRAGLRKTPEAWPFSSAGWNKAGSIRRTAGLQARMHARLKARGPTWLQCRQGGPPAWRVSCRQGRMRA